MMDWQPTCNLQFVERDEMVDRNNNVVICKTVRVLQQEWKREDGLVMWRDVPLAQD